MKLAKHLQLNGSFAWAFRANDPGGRVGLRIGW